MKTPSKPVDVGFEGVFAFRIWQDIGSVGKAALPEGGFRVG